MDTIGFEITPSEILYFRQELPETMQLKDKACEIQGCWTSVAGRTMYCTPHLKQNQQKILRIYNNIHTKITHSNPDNWRKLLITLERSALPEDKSLIKMEKFEQVLAKFCIKLHPKQKEIISNLHRVQYVADPGVINAQPLLDLEKNKQTDAIYGGVELEDSNEELKADLGGYFGDFHRHRIDKSIKKRVSLTEKELVNIVLENNRLTEIAAAIRHIDPSRNGFVTQQEMDDIFRENYSKEMEGRHIFDLIKDYRSSSNKILVDYGRFKKWIYTIV